MSILTTIGNSEWDPNRTEKQCAYCPAQLIGSMRTKEDIWPRWLQSKFPHRRGERNSHFTRKSFIGDKTREFGSLGIRRKIPWLCKSCNNEFSSRIQELVRPAIHNALSRKMNYFTGLHTEILSKWACLSTMTWEFVDKETKAITQSEREEFRNSGKVPKNFSIWMGRYAGTGFQFCHQHINEQDIISPFGNNPNEGDEVHILEMNQITTIGIGGIFLLINSRNKFGEILNRPLTERKFSPSDFFCSRTVELTASGGAIFLPDAFSPLNDHELQNLALEFVRPETRAGVRRIGPIPNLSPDFWRLETIEPDWR